MGPSKTFRLFAICIFVSVFVENVICESTEEDSGSESQEETSTNGLDSQGIYDFMISTKALSTIPFHGSDLIIYEHPNNVPDDKLHPDNRFYVMPVVEIDIKSLRVLYSWMIDAYRLDFMLILWSDDLKDAAIEDIEMLYGYFDEKLGEQKHLSMNQIQMIPMEEVRLIWNSEVPLPDGIWLSRDWIPFSRNPHQLRFSFMCEKENVCKKLQTEMKRNPGEFRKLNLEFTTTVKSGASREIQITGNSLTTSKVFRDLLSEDKFPGGEEGIRYLTSEDLQTLAVEVTESYVAKVTTDAQYVPSQQSLSVAELIYNSLASSKESTAKMSEKAWNSLKWEPDFARPDRVTSQLNDITNVVQAQNGSKYLKIDEKAFDSADNNFAYASEFNKLSSYRSSSSDRESNNGRCSGSYYTRGGGGGVRLGPFSFGGSSSSTSGWQTCTSLFNSVSSRSLSDLDTSNGETNVDQTSVKKAGLSNWMVAGESFNNYLRDQSSYIEFDGEKFIHKPMELHKLTVSELNENVRILTTDIQVQRMQKIYHIKTSISSEITNPYQSEIDKINGRVSRLASNVTQSVAILDEEQKKDIKLLRQDHKEDLESVRIALIKENNALREIQKSMHLNLSTSIGDLNDQHTDFKEDVSQDIAFLHNFTKKLDTGDVAFLIKSTITQSVRTPIFNKVLVNNKDCYSTLTGHFTAPVDGLYLFYFGLQLNSARVTVKLYVGDRYVNFYDYSQFYRSTTMARLSKGQNVYLYLPGTYTVYATNFTWFGGHLIAEE